MPRSISSSNPFFSLWRWLAGAALLVSFASRADSLLEDPSAGAIRAQALEEDVERLVGDFEVYREHFRRILQGTQVGFLNAFYGKAGFALIAPRRSTLVNPPQNYGLGLFVGIGKYFGRNNVLELELANDVYLAATLRYRLEFHVISPTFSFGPVFGFRAKVREAVIKNPFLNEPARNSFIVIGGFVGMPVGRTIVTFEIDYLVNRQAFIYTNAGVQMFF